MRLILKRAGAALALAAALSGHPAAAASRAAVAAAVAARVEADYVFADKGAAAARRVREQAANGAYDRAADDKAFVDALTSDLYAVTKDKHLVVRWSAAGYPPAEAPSADSAAKAAEARAMKRGNFQIPKAEVLAGNVGYLRVDGFQAAPDAGATLTAAMAFLANTDAVIFDLRENGGGDAATVALAISYLVPPLTQLTSYRNRAGAQAQSWSVPYVPGGGWGASRPVYVLTSGKTFSAGEEFAYDLQQLKRATIVGARTRGGANPGVIHRLSDHFRMFVPNEAAINPISRSNWEGTGVTPDVAVEPAEALGAAHRLALEALLDKADASDKPAITEALAGLGR